MSFCYRPYYIATAAKLAGTTNIGYKMMFLPIFFFYSSSLSALEMRVSVITPQYQITQVTQLLTTYLMSSLQHLEFSIVRQLSLFWSAWFRLPKLREPHNACLGWGCRYLAVLPLPRRNISV